MPPRAKARAPRLTRAQLDQLLGSAKLSDDDLLVVATAAYGAPLALDTAEAVIQRARKREKRFTSLVPRLLRAAERLRFSRRVDFWEPPSWTALISRAEALVQAHSVPPAEKPEARTPASRSAHPAAKAERALKTLPAPANAALARPEPKPPLGPALDIPSLDALALIAASAPDTLANAALVLQAQRLSMAEHFQDLLGLTSLRGVESYPYQVETVRRVLRVFRGRALLADEVGLGKTIEALMVLREYQLRGMVQRALIIAPPALVSQWVSELEAKAGLVARSTLDAAVKDDPARFWSEPGIIVASLAAARSARHSDHVQAVAWDITIVDEAHHIKNRQTLSWQLVNKLRSRFLLLLTATPVETDLEEIYNLVTLLRPGQFATPADFRKEYVDPKDPTSPRNRERLRRLLAEVMVRNTRAQSGLRLPPRFVTTVFVEPLPNERLLYDAVKDLVRLAEGSPELRLLGNTLLLEAGSSFRAVHGTLKRRFENHSHTKEWSARLKQLLELSAAVQDTRKLQSLCTVLGQEPRSALVFSRFRETLASLAIGLRAAGFSVLEFHGGLDAHAKAQALRRFRDEGGVLLATDVGGEGQNLQFCSLLVNYDLPWNPMLIEQRIGRLHRIGQTEEVQVFNFCSRGTVEEKVLAVLDGRLHLFDLVVGEMDMVLGNLTDDRDLETRILDMYAKARSDDEIDQGFEALADELGRARLHYEKSRALDEALFHRDFEA